jgi:hypothetical protein
MLRIRVRREDRAATELTAARTAEREAERALEERKNELAEYERTKEERRDRVYDTIMGKPVSREAIDLVQEGVAKIDREGAERADAVVRADEERKRKEEAVVVAQGALNLAIKNRMKIEEHRDAWVLEDLKDQERHAEFELEDFTGRKQDD